MPAAEHQPDFAERAKTFGEKVRRRTEELELTQRELIERTGLSRGYIQLLLNNRGSHKGEDGQYKPLNPTLDVVWRLADALDVEIAYLADPDRPVETSRR